VCDKKNGSVSVPSPQTLNLYTKTERLKKKKENRERKRGKKGRKLKMASFTTMHKMLLT
jgi:hypothetical protein